MDDYVIEANDHPRYVSSALNICRGFSAKCGFIIHLICKRLYLGAGITGANYKVICNYGLFFNVEYFQISCLSLMTIPLSLETADKNS